MDKRLMELLEGVHRENYLIPLFWQHGEEEVILREEMKRIHESGIGAVCLEARPHPDFLGAGWWHDVDIILDEARKLGMKVWILDDAAFPTGFAAGWIRDRYPELRKWYLAERHIDAVGPMQGTSFLVQPWLGEGETLVAAVASKRINSGEAVDGTLLDLTSLVRDGVLYWDLPEGCWRLFFLVMTREGGEVHTRDYLNPIVPESTRVLIDAVYEAHYAHYAEEFGKTFAGFFSDEPRFGNADSLEASIGRKSMVLPWRPDMLELLKDAFEGDMTRYLPCLWHEAGEKTVKARYTYMDVVSRLYGEHFSGQLGDWCREHGVEYIGHVIEDNNAHARLGYSTGHYYRSLWGQDMSGLDVVLHQILPGLSGRDFSWVAGAADGEFFHYGLAKMASSLGHLDPKKKGRTLCEIFGAYGWAEGLKLMKWLVDHMLVRGVNRLMPHAFTPREFPDPDCPPHFYARGQNPQYRFFGYLMRYADRICHLLSGGLHIAPVAVLYHAEAEWSGEYMLFQKPVRELLQHQLDCDILPADIFRGQCLVKDGELCVNGETYQCLVVPYAQRLPGYLLKALADAANEGLRIFFIDKLPEESSDGDPVKNLLSSLGCSTRTVSLDDLAQAVRTEGLQDVEVKDFVPDLRYYHYVRQETHFFLFFNEDPVQSMETTVTLPVEGPVVWYDAFENRVGIPGAKAGSGRTELHLQLSPYESRMIIIGGEQPVTAGNIQDFAAMESGQCVRLPRKGWRISISEAGRYPDFQLLEGLDSLENLCTAERLPRFAGTAAYELEFEWEETTSPGHLKLGDVYETAEVWLNDHPLGVRICPPYTFEVTGALKQGSNRLRVEVTNTLGRNQQDMFSRYIPQEPVGLVGPVEIIRG